MHKRILTENGWRSKNIIDRNNNLKKEHKLFFDNLKYKNKKYKIVQRFLKEQNVCYVYFLFYFDQLVYIGKSINPDSRITAHSFKHNLIRKIKTTELLAEKWETKLIKRYKPIHNKSGVKYFKAYFYTKKSYLNPYLRIRLESNKKINLNLKFNKKIISGKINKSKISYTSNNYLTFKQFLKEYPTAKYYFILNNNKIYFYDYKPNNLDAKLITKNVNL